MDSTIPAEALRGHVAILGMTGSGKSNAAKTVVEAELDARQRVCVIDPTGAWWGLRLTPDRKPSGYDVVIFGGLHGDIDISGDQGGAIAEIIATTATPAIIDTRLMTVGQRTRFFADFAQTLLRKNRGSLRLVIDEAHVFAPQGRVADPKSGEMLHAANNLVSLGRSIGLKIMMISQRPAKLHKDSLTQAATLVALRVIAPHDRRAVEDWVGEWSTNGKDLLESLPGLPKGDAWIWSPEISFLERRHFPLCRTFDSGRPLADDEEPPELQPLEIGEIRERLMVEADAPAPNRPSTDAALIKRLRADVITSYQRGWHEGRVDLWKALMAHAPEETPEKPQEARGLTVNVTAPTPQAMAATPAPARRTTPAKPSGLPPAAARLLAAFGRYPTRGLTWEEACVVAAMIPGNGYFYGGRKALVEGQHVYQAGERWRIHDEDGNLTPRHLTRGEFRQLWSHRKQPAPRMLDVIAEAGGEWVPFEQLAAETGLKPGNGFWYGGLSQLRQASLIEQEGQRVRLAPFIAEARR